MTTTRTSSTRTPSTHPARHRRGAATALALLVLVGSAGCSAGDDEPQDATTAGEAAPTFDGVSPDDLRTCLGDAGIPSRTGTSVPLGVEDPVIEVDADGGVTLWVFPDAETAEANRSTITLTDSDTPSDTLVGNVVAHYDDPDTAPTEAVDQCLT
jgi:hypothetical protein